MSTILKKINRLAIKTCVFCGLYYLMLVFVDAEEMISTVIFMGGTSHVEDFIFVSLFAALRIIILFFLPARVFLAMGLMVFDHYGASSDIT